MLTAENITKSYRRRTVISDVSFSCRPGTVVGFLGPNGAGKSTTMRIIAGLTSPTSGTSTIDGATYDKIPNPGRVLGTLIDARALAPTRTGFENLRLVAMTLGRSDLDLLAELQRVGLDESAGRKRVGEYSLGMRQRLGIAQALLGRPKYLMLDEPVNGLDPVGILWMRRILRDFARDGGGVLLSSHLLHEVEVVADELVLLNKGHVIAQGTTADLMRTGETVVAADRLEDLAAVVSGAGIPVVACSESSLTVAADPAFVGDLARRHDISLHELRENDMGALEDLFLGMTTPTAAAA